MKPPKDSVIIWILIIICLVLLTTQMLVAKPSHKHELIWDNLTNEQKQYARIIWDRAKNYRLTMIALAWQESRLGQSLENPKDPSAGIIHILLPTFLKINGKKDTPKNRQMARELLIAYPYVSIDTSILIFEHFLKYHAPKNKEILDINEAIDVYKKSIKSFNCGYNINKEKCNRYYNDVMHHISMLEKIPIKNFIMDKDN